MVVKIDGTSSFLQENAAKNQSVIVESKNTGQQWRMKEKDLERFLQGRNRHFYRIFRRAL